MSVEKELAATINYMDETKADNNHNINETIEVGVFIFVNRINQINIVAESIQCDFETIFSWKASKEDYDTYCKDPTSYAPEWFPKFNILNGSMSKEELHKDKNEGFRVIKLGDKDVYGNVVNKCRLPFYHEMHHHFEGVFSQSFELRYFPFDCQDLQITFESAEKINKAIFVPYHAQHYGDYMGCLNLKYSGIGEYIVHSPFLEFFTNKYGSEFAAFNLRMKFERKWTSYFWKICFFLMITSLSTLTAFTIQFESVADRYGLLYTLLLTAVAFQFVVSTLLPNLPYLTLLDYYVLFSFSFIFLIIIEVAIVTSISTQFSDGDIIDVTSVDKVMFYISVVIWILGHIVFTIMCYKARKYECGTLKLDKFAYNNYGGYVAKDDGQNTSITISFSESGSLSKRLLELIKQPETFDDVGKEK